MILPIYNNDSIVYKTSVRVQKDNNNVQNKDSNVHVRLLRKARKVIEAEVEAVKECLAQVIDLAEFVINLLKLVKALCLPSNVILVSHRGSLNVSMKGTHIWDVCLNAYGKRVWA